MTSTEMEDALKNVDRRLTGVEQILPTLATKDDLLATRADLHGEIFSVKRDLSERIEESKRHASILFDDVRDDIRKVAEGVAALTMIVQDMGARSDRTFEAIDRRLDTLTVRLERVEDRLPSR